MASPDYYGALLNFLDGDSGDLRTRVNALHTGLLSSGSVTFTRPSRGKTAQRGRNVKSPCVDIIPAETAGATRPAGIGVQEVDYDVRFEITVRQKDLPVGKNQLRTLQTLQNDLVYLYEGLSNLSITDPNSVATFSVASARRGPPDRNPEVTEQETATVLATFTFVVPMPANT